MDHQGKLVVFGNQVKYQALDERIEVILDHPILIFRSCAHSTLVIIEEPDEI
jgi:predicted ATP-dependent endonuclease of OLD family